MHNNVNMFFYSQIAIAAISFFPSLKLQDILIMFSVYYMSKYH